MELMLFKTLEKKIAPDDPDIIDNYNSIIRDQRRDEQRQKERERRKEEERQRIRDGIDWDTKTDYGFLKKKIEYKMQQDPAKYERLSLMLEGPATP